MSKLFKRTKILATVGPSVFGEDKLKEMVYAGVNGFRLNFSHGTYGELLTAHQKEIYSEAVFNDLSLSELSEEEGISRQGIHDLIKRCDKLLEGYEEKLKLIERFNSIKEQVCRIEGELDSLKISDEDKASLKEQLQHIIEDL